MDDIAAQKMMEEAEERGDKKLAEMLRLHRYISSQIRDLLIKRADERALRGAMGGA